MSEDEHGSKREREVRDSVKVRSKGVCENEGVCVCEIEDKGKNAGQMTVRMIARWLAV